MKRTISTISLVIAVFAFSCSFLILAAPPGCFPIYVGVAVLAGVAILCGGKMHKLIGIVLFVASTSMAFVQWHEGKQLQRRLEHIRKK
jgi:hypothetical protein